MDAQIHTDTFFSLSNAFNAFCGCFMHANFVSVSLFENTTLAFLTVSMEAKEKYHCFAIVSCIFLVINYNGPS